MASKTKAYAATVSFIIDAQQLYESSGISKICEYDCTAIACLPQLLLRVYARAHAYRQCIPILSRSNIIWLQACREHILSGEDLYA